MPQKKKDNTQADGKDLFQTPHYATRLLLPFLKPYTTVWECAAGQGRMVEILETQHAVWGSDIKVPDPATLSPGDFEFEQWDFLEQTRNDVWMAQINYIITNPPFGKKQAFYKKCMFYWREYNIPFALLIPADYSGWIINAVYHDMCQKLIPTRRIDYITPTGLHGGNGHTSRFHSMWLVKGLNIEMPKPILPTEIYVPLSLKSKKEDIL